MKIEIKKDKGGYIDELFPIIIAAIAMAIFIVIFANFMANVDKKNDVDQVARKYILHMEADGYLTTEDKNALVTELTDLGVINIDLQDTTMSQVGYGDSMTLSIRGDLKIKNMGVGDKLTFFENDGTIPIYVRKVTTAKH